MDQIVRVGTNVVVDIVILVTFTENLLRQHPTVLAVTIMFTLAQIVVIHIMVALRRIVQQALVQPAGGLARTQVLKSQLSIMVMVAIKWKHIVLVVAPI